MTSETETAKAIAEMKKFDPKFDILDLQDEVFVLLFKTIGNFPRNIQCLFKR